MTLSYYTYSVFYTVLNPDLFGHLKDPYTTVFVSILAICPLVQIVLEKYFFMSIRIFTWINKKKSYKVTLPKADCSFYHVTGIFLVQNYLISFIRDMFNHYYRLTSHLQQLIPFRHWSK